MSFYDASKRNHLDPQCIYQEARSMVLFGLDMITIIKDVASRIYD